MLAALSFLIACGSFASALHAASLAKSAETEAQRLWSLRPLSTPPVPAVREVHWLKNPIDAFILARLEKANLRPSPEASRPMLLRRLSFDLRGLPPSREEIDQFVKDPRPDAYERRVEQLLASPAYGERWARHWLDVARYTESNGFEYDKLRDNAWHYRDYVIDSFNANKPYDQFVREQLAGDVLDPVTPESMIATSLLVCGPWDEPGSNQANKTQRMITREEEMEDLVSVVGQTFLGLTVNCARCHAHKFDPISHGDYYSFRAVFDGVRHGEHPVIKPDDLAGIRREISRLKAEAAANEKEIARVEKRARSEAGGDPSKVARERIDSLLSDAEKSERVAHELAQKRASEAASSLERKLPVSYIGQRVQPPTAHRLLRGDVTQIAEVVRPGALSALAASAGDLGLEADAPEAERRRRLALWMTHPKNPLPPRVMANRLWHYHFGQGIVATPNDLGEAGSKPSHPELLDWLARRLIDSGGNLKELHRLIVRSATYRQSSTGSEKGREIDADNSLLWRFAPKRLEAEALRDAMLALGGELNLAMGGPSFRAFEFIKFPTQMYLPIDREEPGHARRTIYRMNVNSGKDPMLDSFDCPDPSFKTPKRGVTTTPLQALSIMNGPFSQRMARSMARRLAHMPNATLKAQVRAAYDDCLGRPPTPTESAEALKAASAFGLQIVCWTLLNSTEFVYVR